MTRKYVGLILGLIAFSAVLFFTDLKPGKPEVTRTLAVALLMAFWWVSEAIPLAVTALVPLVLFPFLGILDGKEVSSTYFNYIIFVFLGGFVMALAMEKWNLHKRIALKILMLVGVSPGRILLGFMLATAFLSMWISNTASTMMMIPIVMSIISSLEENRSIKGVGHYSTGLFLAIAYSASIGGIATLVGTPTNLVFPRILTLMYPGAPEISFANWFFFALPVTLVMLLAILGVIYLMYRPRESWRALDKDHFRMKYEKLGPTSFEERTVLVVFLCLAFLWIFRADIKFDSFTIPGWSSIFGTPAFINDGTVAMMAAILLFILPARDAGGSRIMDWETARRLPWNIVLLFGGGFALALGFQSSGLAIWFGEQLAFTRHIHPYLILLAVITLMSFLTELTSNVASTQMLLPVFASLAVSSGNNPILLMIPATIASSLAFMLPTATPPNAIIFGTERLEIRTMVRTGFLLNMTGILVLFLVTWLLGDRVLDIELGTFPDWVNSIPK